MAYSAKVILDSISDAGVRLTTIEVSLPRIVLAEFNTHRVFSRNAASSRAIPVKKMIERVQNDPFIPRKWGRNEKGMQANTNLNDAEAEQARKIWLEARDLAIAQVEKLVDPEGLNVHKQLANRLLEPWMWVTDIVTATEFENFKGLRVSPEAQPDFEIAARMMQEAQDASTPTYLKPGEWHLPYVTGYDREEIAATHAAVDICRHESRMIMAEISAARCARVSYLTHDGKRDLSADRDLFTRLTTQRHLSPLEHPAQALANPIPIGNYVGWFQLRKWIPGEAVYRKK